MSLPFPGEYSVLHTLQPRRVLFVYPTKNPPLLDYVATLNLYGIAASRAHTMVTVGRLNVAHHMNTYIGDRHTL